MLFILAPRSRQVNPTFDRHRGSDKTAVGLAAVSDILTKADRFRNPVLSRPEKESALPCVTRP
ncbi:hypothetical protein ACSS6W_007129 [Trichoderma asperelloides]